MRRRTSKRGRSGRKRERTFRMSMLLVATQRGRGRPRRLLYSNLIHLCLYSGIVIPPLSPLPLVCCCPFFHLQMGIRSGRGGREEGERPRSYYSFLPPFQKILSLFLSLGRPIALFPSLMFVPRSTWNALQYRHDVKNRVGLREFTQLHPSTTRDTGVARERLDII